MRVLAAPQAKFGLVLCDLSDPEGDELVADLVLVSDDLLELRLWTIPATGYRWAIVEAPAHLRDEGDPYHLPAPGEIDGLVGGGCVEVLRWRATSEGKGTIRLAYARPWEDEAPLRTATIGVRTAGSVRDMLSVDERRSLTERRRRQLALLSKEPAPDRQTAQDLADVLDAFERLPRR